MFKKILVGLDGSEGSRRALSTAIQLGVQHGSELLALSVEEGLPHYAAMVDEVQEALLQATEYFSQLQREAYEQAKQAGIEMQCATLPGHAAQRIIEYAGAQGVELLVLGHSGHTGVWGQFLGTTADKIVRHAPCSVLIVR